MTEETRTPDEIRDDIEKTREELGDTVEALGAKTDVKSQAKAKVEDVKSSVSGKVADASSKVQDATPAGAQQGGQAAAARVKENPAPFLIGGALLLGFLIGRRSGG
jgi:ElaB/YqjD/DUF883 family membrane-anchored ribosome-binding protein